MLCWSGPIADQALAWAGSSRGHGNLATLVDAAQSRETPVGLQGDAHAVARAIGVRPRGCGGHSLLPRVTFEIFGRLPLAALVSSLVVLVGLAVLMFIGVRRRRRDVAGAIALALVLCAALGAVTASFPNTPSTIFSYSYASWWAAPVGMWTWIAPGLGDGDAVVVTATSTVVSHVGWSRLLWPSARWWLSVPLLLWGKGPIPCGTNTTRTRTVVRGLDAACRARVTCASTTRAPRS